LNSIDTVEMVFKQCVKEKKIELRFKQWFKQNLVNSNTICFECVH